MSADDSLCKDNVRVRVWVICGIILAKYAFLGMFWRVLRVYMCCLFFVIVVMIVTRFAPSPTGYLHIGGVRTALYCWLLAKKLGGKYLLRIEDTDVERSTKAYEQNIIDSFEWLGLEWDAGPGKNDQYGPYYQMERLDIYMTYVQKLLDSGHAYYAWESPEEIDVMRQEAEARKQQFIYRQPIYTQEQVEKFQAE
jgi:glutamyl/glutaminyl-tRNA synthetase